MRDEVRQILKMVQAGKIGAEDAAELIDAFEQADVEAPGSEEARADEARPGEATSAKQAGGESTAGKDPVTAFVESMGKFGRDAAQSVDWSDIARQIRTSARQGVEALRTGLDQINKGHGFGWFAIGESREITLPLSVPQGKTLRIENPTGDVRVHAGHELGAVTAQAQFRGPSAEDNKRRAEEYTLLVEESENMVLIRQPNIPNLCVNLDVRLAAGAPVEVKTEAGEILVMDTESSCRINARSADVRLRGLDGPVEVTLISGDIIVEDVVSPQCTLENKSGDLALRRIVGNLSARTTSGDLEVDELDAKSVSLETVSGDVHVSLASPITGTVNVRTVSGDVAMLVPDGCDCRVSLSTLRGDIACDLDMAEVQRGDQRMTGRLGEGAGSLDVSAVNGDLRVRLARTDAHE